MIPPGRTVVPHDGEHEEGAGEMKGEICDVIAANVKTADSVVERERNIHKRPTGGREPAAVRESGAAGTCGAPRERLRRRDDAMAENSSQKPPRPLTFTGEL